MRLKPYVIEYTTRHGKPGQFEVYAKDTDDAQDQADQKFVAWALKGNCTQADFTVEKVSLKYQPKEADV